MSGIDRTLQRLSSIWAPPPKFTVTEWADNNRQLSKESSAKDGQWRTRPYQKEPMDAFTDPLIHTIVLMVAIQTLKTEVINNCIAYAIDQDAGPILVVQFRDTDCKRYSKIRLAPMLRDTPCLRGKVSADKSRSSENTFDYKAFPGGHLSIVASSSPGNLAALPIRYLFCDEIDKYPASAGAAGDPISLAMGRQVEFWNRKTVLACSPTTEKGSRIGEFFEESDKREYEIPCPKCGMFQIPAWANVKWDNSLPKHRRAETARYLCANAECGAAWNDRERFAAIHLGRYRATAPFNGIAGFRVSGLCRLGTKLGSLVNEFLSKKGNPEALKTFVNEQLAELWHEPGEVVEWERLASRANEYDAGTIPQGGLFLVAGADVQRGDGGRIEVEIVAYGRNRESWSTDYRVLTGLPSEPEVWLKLDELLAETFPHASGCRLPISRLFIDSGDGTTQMDVYTWVRRQSPDRVTAIKGDDRGSVPVSPPSYQDVARDGKKFGLWIKTVKVSYFKSEFYAQLKLRAPTPEEQRRGLGYPPGYCHFPSGTHYGDEHFKQLTAEQLVAKKNKRTGRIAMEWTLMRARNEALDARIYARAAAWDVGLDQAQEIHWTELEQDLNARAVKALRPPDPPKPPPPPKAEVKEQTSSWRDNEDGGRYMPRKNWFGRKD